MGEGQPSSAVPASTLYTAVGMKDAPRGWLQEASPPEFQRYLSGAVGKFLIAGTHGEMLSQCFIQSPFVHKCQVMQIIAAEDSYMYVGTMCRSFAPKKLSSNARKLEVGSTWHA